MPLRLPQGPKRRLQLRLGLALLLLQPVQAAWAGSIGFRIDTTVETQPSLEVTVKITHTGDEAASKVRPSVNIAKTSTVGETLEHMEPNTSHSWTLLLTDPAVEKGVFVAVVRLSYNDQNGYPFEVIATAPVNVRARARARVKGRITVRTVPENDSVSGSISLTLPPNRGTQYAVDLVVPSGLSIQPSFFRVSTDGKKQVSRQLTIKNKNLLVGTAVNIYAVVRGLDEEFIQSDVIKGIVRISKAHKRLTTKLIMQVCGGLLLLLIALEIVARRESS